MRIGLLSAVRIQIKGEECLLSQVLDITDQRRTEEALEKSETRYRRLFNNAMDAIYLVGKDGHIIDVNDSAIRMIGRTREDICRLTISNIDVNGSRDAFLDLWKGRSPDQPHLFESVHRRADSSVFPVEINGMVFHEENERFFYGIVRDISKRKRIEEALRDSERRHRVIFEKSPLGMIRFDSEGTIIDFNEAFIRLMGSSREKIIGFNTARRSTPKMRRAIQKALTGKASVFEDQYTSVTGGKTRYLRAVFNPVTPGQSPTEVIATLEDITERKQAEKEKEALLIQLHQTRKDESLNRMAGAVAHHFNNHLSAVLGSLELAMGGLSADQKTTGYLNMAFEAACRASELSDLMLTCLGRADVERKPLDLSACWVANPQESQIALPIR